MKRILLNCLWFELSKAEFPDEILTDGRRAIVLQYAHLKVSKSNSSRMSHREWMFTSGK